MRQFSLDEVRSAVQAAIDRLSPKPAKGECTTSAWIEECYSDYAIAREADSKGYARYPFTLSIVKGGPVAKLGKKERVRKVWQKLTSASELADRVIKKLELP